MLPSTLLTGSASANFCLSRLNNPPHRIRCVRLRTRRCRRLRKHSLPGAPLRPTRTGLSTGWIRASFSLAHKQSRLAPAVAFWIASSRSLSSGAHSRDPLASRNDGGGKPTAVSTARPTKRAPSADRPARRWLWLAGMGVTGNRRDLPGANEGRAVPAFSRKLPT